MGQLSFPITLHGVFISLLRKAKGIKEPYWGKGTWELIRKGLWENISREENKKTCSNIISFLQVAYFCYFVHVSKHPIFLHHYTDVSIWRAKDNLNQFTITPLLTRSEVSDFFTVTGAKAAAEPTKKVRAIEAENCIIFVLIE